MRNTNEKLTEKIKDLESNKETLTIGKLEDLINNYESIEEVVKLVKAKWPEKSMKKTKTTTKSIITQAPTRILVVSETNSKDQDILTRMSAVHPKLGKVVKKAANK